jgi:DNA-binding response OmpR family regulator
MSRRILLAEDNPVFQAILETLLTKWGYQVVLVSGGEKALEILRKEDGPRLAILDWFMPGLSGPEVCRRIRASKMQHYVYLLLLTASDRSGDAVTGIEAGADDYLTKPFIPNELRARLTAAHRLLGSLKGRHACDAVSAETT